MKSEREQIATNTLHTYSTPYSACIRTQTSVHACITWNQIRSVHTNNTLRTVRFWCFTSHSVCFRARSQLETNNGVLTGWWLCVSGDCLANDGQRLCRLSAVVVSVLFSFSERTCCVKLHLILLSIYSLCHTHTQRHSHACPTTHMHMINLIELPIRTHLWCDTRVLR